MSETLFNLDSTNTLVPSDDEIARGNMLSILVPFDRLKAVKFKIGRIQKQEKFEKLNRARFGTLTNREREIIALLVEGFNNPRVAETLNISRYTVEQHRKNINRKLAIHSFADLTTYALAFNLI